MKETHTIRIIDTSPQILWKEAPTRPLERPQLEVDSENPSGHEGRTIFDPEASEGRWE